MTDAGGRIVGPYERSLSATLTCTYVKRPPRCGQQPGVRTRPDEEVMPWARVRHPAPTQVRRAEVAVSRRLRYEVLRRDNHTCRYCGASAPDVKLTVDHVTPSALGGKDDPSNLVTACQQCNAGKSSTNPDAPLVADVSADAIRWEKARKVAINQWREVQICLTSWLEDFAQAWDRWGAGEGDDRIVVPRETGWEDSVERWLNEGFDIDDLIELIPKAMRAKGGKGSIEIGERWRYYCGIVWRTLDDIQQQTAQHLEDDISDEAEAEGMKDVAYDAFEVGSEQGFYDAVVLIARMADKAGSVRCSDCGEHQEFDGAPGCLRCLARTIQPRWISDEQHETRLNAPMPDTYDDDEVDPF